MKTLLIKITLNILTVLAFIIGGLIGICLIPFSIIIATPDFYRSIKSSLFYRN